MNHLLLFFKGMAMGAADVVPGVSGGTVAFITGIYQRLLNAIKSVNLQALQVLRREGLAAVWRHIDGTFLLVLFAGILTSIFTLAKGITWAMGTYPQLLWAFFLGLVLASTLFVGRQIKTWTGGAIAAFIAGAAVAYVITILPTGQVSTAYPMIFLAGAIAICAMILPGISGSFILLLMGMYHHVLEAVHQRNIIFLVIFVLGCGFGLLSFARVLSWTFKHYYWVTMALLTGFMVGSLNKVWPWQNVLKTRTNSKGEEVPFLYENVLPQNYQGEAMLWACVGVAVLGFVVVLLLERLGQGKEQE
jgi:putative membrane protein